MITRRGAAGSLLAGIWTLVSCARSGRSPRTPASRPDITGPGTPDAFVRQLLRDFERTGSRTYSEEGITVFLVGENLAARSPERSPGRSSRESNGAELAAAFRHGAAVLPGMRPAVTPDDVGKLIEVLADRDFGTARRQAVP